MQWRAPWTRSARWPIARACGWTWRDSKRRRSWATRRWYANCCSSCSTMPSSSRRRADRFASPFGCRTGAPRSWCRRGASASPPTGLALCSGGCVAGRARAHGLRPGYGVLLDVRDMSYIPSWADAQAYQRLFAGLRASYTGGLALVVSGTAPYGVARMMSVMFGFIGVQLGAFTELAEATPRLLPLHHSSTPVTT